MTPPRGIGPRRILDIQMRAREIGRIRLGGHKGERTPGKPLDKFRFTSPNEEAIKYAAGAFGGTPQQWEGQWEVFSEVSEIEIGVPGNIDPVSASYEDWTGGRCVKRCDGQTEWLSGEPCSCDPESRTCKPTIRLSLLVPAIPIMGVWRLESHGYNANAELVALAEFAQAVPGHTRGVLRLERRSDKREDPKNPGKTITRNYIVPVLDLHVSVAALIEGGNGETRPQLPKPTRPALPPGPEPEPLPPRTAGMPPAPEASVVDETPKEPTTGAERFAAMVEAFGEPDTRKALDALGITTRRGLTAEKYREAWELVTGWKLGETRRPTPDDAEWTEHGPPETHPDQLGLDGAG